MIRNTEGATAIEYALVMALIALACIAAAEALSGSVTAMLITNGAVR